MLKDENKMITGKEKFVQNKELYFFPDHGVTVEASSQEEAYQELQALINKKKK
jgi:hypothetical protein